MRVALKVALLVLVVLLCMQGVLGALRIRREARIVTGELERDHRLLGAALVEAVERADPEGDQPEAVAELLEQIESAEGAIALSLQEGGGAHVNQRIRDGQLVTEIPTRLGGAPMRLVLEEPLTEVQRVVSEGRRRLLGTGTLLVLVGLAAAALGGHVVVGRRLEALVLRSEAIGGGDLAPRAVREGGDELRELARALEDLAGRLGASQRHALAEQEARLATLEQLRHADRLRLVGDLAAGLAHELGSPLHVVAGNAELLEHDRSLGDEPRQIAAEIHDQVRRLSGLVNRLLELAHPEPVRGEPTDLQVLWDDLRATSHGLARGTGVRIVLGDPVAERVDLRPPLFVQAMANLVRNAVQAQPDGGEVRLSARVDGDAVELRVEDDGPGVPETLRDRIFSPFVTTKAPGQGVGLGLALVEGLVEEAGGTIHIEDGPGGRFVVRLPRLGTEAT